MFIKVTIAAVLGMPMWMIFVDLQENRKRLEFVGLPASGPFDNQVKKDFLIENEEEKW